jgi:hypothetical protein
MAAVVVVGKYRLVFFILSVAVRLYMIVKK